MNTIFITGIGTDVGKTVAAAILTEALEAGYWKPVQAGYDEATDSEFIHSAISNKKTIIHPETYKLKLAASPHIAAREEGIKINLDKIYEEYSKIVSHASLNANDQRPTDKSQQAGFETNNNQQLIIDDEGLPVNNQQTIANLIIEGAGGLMVPLNEKEFVVDLIKRLNASVILVSRNYLGSINHSLITAAVCRQNNLNVLGWIFNVDYMNYEDEIVQWSGYPKIASLPFAKKINEEFISQQASIIKHNLKSVI